jgi:ABC-type methionine transport system ATPase subunit
MSLSNGLRAAQECSLQLLNQKLWSANKSQLVNVRGNIGYIF